MGILSVLGKTIKVAVRYPFSDGVDAISKARKAVPGSIFSKNGVSVAKQKAVAGWGALKTDVVNTANSNKSIWQGISNFAKSFISKPKAGIRLAEQAAAKAGKTAGFWAKAGGALKGFGKAFGKMPVIGTLITIGLQVPNIYDAFSRGGVWEGIKQTGKSALTVLGATAGSALGTVVGGPIGGIIGFAAGEWLTEKLLGGSYTENHPKETEETSETAENTQTEEAQGSQPSEDNATTDTQAQATEENEEATQSNETSSNGSTTTNPTTTNPIDTTITNPSISQVNPFGPAMAPTFGPMGMAGNPFGGVNPIMPAPTLEYGQSIFDLYDFGLRFNYIN